MLENPKAFISYPFLLPIVIPFHLNVVGVERQRLFNLA